MWRILVYCNLSARSKKQKIERRDIPDQRRMLEISREKRKKKNSVLRKHRKEFVKKNYVHLPTFRQQISRSKRSETGHCQQQQPTFLVHPAERESQCSLSIFRRAATGFRDDSTFWRHLARCTNSVGPQINATPKDGAPFADPPA